LTWIEFIFVELYVRLDDFFDDVDIGTFNNWLDIEMIFLFAIDFVFVFF
jgi:hypothetical protein